jgi:hypothetical protein
MGYICYADLKLVVLYICGGPSEHAQHLYLYCSVTRFQSILGLFDVKFNVADVEVGILEFSKLCLLVN